MITILFHMTVKPERQAEVEMLAKDIMATTRTEDGCIAYTIFRRADQPCDFVLFEQWRDADALAAHIAVLRRRFGPPDDQEPYPETHHRRRLPKAFLALFEKTEAVRYEALE
jgi:antibiotic biosynthesis monooxygenase (ABM) superfamily enzyme